MQIIEIRSRVAEFSTKNTVIQLCGDELLAKTDLAAGTASVAGSIIKEISLPWLAAPFNSRTSELNLGILIKLSTRLARLTDSFLLINCDDINLA